MSHRAFGQISCCLPTLFCGAMLSLGLSTPSPVHCQVYTVPSVDPKYTPLPSKITAVSFSNQPLTSRTRMEIVRLLEGEEAFTMRAMPLGSHGMVLVANGKLTPEGLDYRQALSENGISTKPGDKVQITDVRVYASKIVFDLNGGPEGKHRWMRHITIGSDPSATNPIASGSGEAVGSRITLVFPKFVPELTGTQTKELLSPLLDFSLKSPTEAYVDTLPAKLKEAIVDHRVLVGMNREMVVHALGTPERKDRETDSNGFLYEEWIYGEPPRDIQFVRFMGDRVVRLEIASVGALPRVRETDETDGYLSGKVNERVIAMGDAAKPNEDGAKPPTLRAPGEPVPANQPQAVLFPHQTPSNPPNPSTQAPASAPPPLPGNPTSSTAPTPANGSGNGPAGGPATSPAASPWV